MYQLVRSKRFTKSLRRLRRSGQLSSSVREDLEELSVFLTRGELLPHSFFDHQLQGEYAEYRECHIRGDLLLMYRRNEEIRVIAFMDIGTHSQLFG